MARNLELKVRCHSHDHRRVLGAIPADGIRERRTLRQRDTYFVVPQGRLKLREIAEADDQSAELIQYARPDVAGMRLSTYRRTVIDPAQAAMLRDSLGESLGTLTVVDKTREVIVWRATRIHLDDVAGLGRFIELETVLGDGDGAEEDGRAEFDAVVEMLGLDGLEVVPGSYSDLMMKEQHAQ